MKSNSVPNMDARRANSNFSSTSTARDNRLDSDRYKINSAPVKKSFTPSPIISPVYGILDKNYTKDDIVDKKGGLKMNTIKPVEELTFTDDFMFTTIMKDKEICKELLERLLKIKVSNINYPVAQKSLAPFFETKGVRLDVYVDDGKRVFVLDREREFSVEVGFNFLTDDNIASAYVVLP